jgi:hypothetical protein
MESNNTDSASDLFAGEDSITEMSGRRSGLFPTRKRDRLSDKLADDTLAASRLSRLRSILSGVDIKISNAGELAGGGG